MRFSWIIFLFINLFFMPSYAKENSITAGTEIKVRMAEPVDSRVHKAGYRFKVTVESDLKRDNKVIIKSGSMAQAIVNKIQRPGRGQQTPRLIVTLITVEVNNRQLNIETFPLAGIGTTNVRKRVNEIDKEEDAVTGKNGEKITASIPLVTKGYDITLSEGTVLYFILKEPISL